MLAIIFVARKGGISYLLNRLPFYQNPIPRENQWTIYYKNRKSLFENLPNAQKQIVFLGDSLTDSSEWREMLGNPRIVNRGIYGDTTKGIFRRLEEIVESQPEKIFLMIGINDLDRGWSVSDIYETYEKILIEIREKSPETQVFVQSVLPINNQEYDRAIDLEKIVLLNSQLKELSWKYSYQYIDLFSQFIDDRQQLDPKYTLDGVHLNGEGYIKWKQAIEQYVNEETGRESKGDR